MPQVDIDGANSKVSADTIRGQSGTTVTVPTGHVLTVTDAAGLTVAGSTVLAADNSVTLAKMAGGTDGQIITYDASGDPVAVGPGTDGQVLTSTGAGSPPAFEAAAAGGAWTLIGTSVASASASLDQTGMDSTYDTYCVAWSDIILATTGQNLQMRLGDSGGFDSGASDYSFHKQSCYSGSGAYAGVVSAGASAIRVGSGMTNGTGVGTAGVVYLTQPADGATFPMVCGTTVTNDSTAGVVEGGMISGCRIAQITIDRVQILSTSGNITSGRMTVWGIKHT